MIVPSLITHEVGQQHIEFMLNIVMTFPCHKFNNSVRLSTTSYLNYVNKFCGIIRGND